MDAADADDTTTPTTNISNRGFDLVGFTLALDNLTLLVEDESRRGDLTSMHNLLRRVQKLYKILREKAEVADPDVMVALGKVLAFFLNLDRVKDEPLCREACNFVSLLARGWTYRGAEFAMIVTPDLLACLEKGDGAVNSSAYQGMCAIVSHCYEAEGRLLALILDAMNGNTRRQLYQLIKIAIEKWPPSSVKAHMAALRERLALDIMSTSRFHREWSTQSFLMLTRKYPEQGVQAFHRLTKETQSRLLRDHPILQASMPRHTRRGSSNSGNSSNSSSVTSQSLLISPLTSASFTSPLPARKRLSGSTAAAAAAGEGGPPVTKPSSSDSQQELHQKLLKFKLENNPRFKDAALQAALSRPVAWELSSDDGSTSSSIRSDGTGPNSGSRDANSASRRAEQMLRHKMNVMSPTDYHLIAEAHANNRLLVGGLASPKSPMILFQQDLNHRLANLDHMREEDAVIPAIDQAAAAADPAAAAAAEDGRLDEGGNVAEQYLDCNTRAAAQFNQNEDHYEGDDENTSTIQGSNSTRKGIIANCNGHSFSSRSKRVSFADELIVTLSPATPLFLPTPIQDRFQQDDRNSLDGSIRPSDEQGSDKDERDEEEDVVCFDHDSGIDEQDLSVSKKSLIGDIAEEEEREMEAEDEKKKKEEEDEEGNVNPKEGENDGEMRMGLNLGWDFHFRTQEIECVNPRNCSSRAYLLLLISISVFFVTGLVNFLSEQEALGIAPLLQRQRATDIHISLEPRRENSKPPPADIAIPRAKDPNVITPIIVNRADPTSSPEQKHLPFREQQKCVGADDLSVIAGIESCFELKSQSRLMRKDIQPTQEKNVWHHVRHAMERLINYRMLGVLLGYTLLFSFLL